MPEKLSPSRIVAAKTIFAAFKILQSEGGKLPGNEVIDRIRKTVDFNEWEKEVYEKTGYVRWEAILHFYSVDSIKAGFLRKDKGIWYLTEEGEKAMKLGPNELIATASLAYKKWAADKKSKANNSTSIEIDIPAEEMIEKEEIQKLNIEKLEDEARTGIKAHLKEKGPYEFQDMVAALLRTMGYYTPFVAPRGKDGGIDIIAYQDAFGAKTPRIKVQVKHKPDYSVPVADIRSLKGVINRDNEIGLFVTSGRFSSEAEAFARETDIHIKLIAVEEFIQLWQDNYSKLSDEEKNWLPLKPIYFLGSND